MQSKRAFRYLMFALLYFTQGTVLSYFTALNALYLLDHGLTMTNVGIFATIALVPFVIKIFLGMLSDRVNLLGMGHRKPYIILGLIIQAACLVVVPWVNPATHYWRFVALAFVLQMGMALYDTCTDGLALDTTPEGEEGTIQAFMVGGRAVGVVLTASAVGLLAQHSGWNAVFWLLAVLTLLPLPLVLTTREGERPAGRRFEWGAFRAFGGGSTLAVAGIGFVFFLVIVGVNQNVNPFLEQAFSISLSTAGFITTVWGIGVVVGSAVAGMLITRLGKRLTAIAALILSLVAAAALAFIPQMAYAWPAAVLFGIAYGTCQTLFFALAMDATDPRIAASMFAILMAVTNIAQGVGMALAGSLADGIGFRPTFIVLALCNVLVLPLLPIVFKRGKGMAAAG